MDPHTRESRGFAFVSFEDAESAEIAVRDMNGIEVHGKPLKVEMVI